MRGWAGATCLALFLAAVSAADDAAAAAAAGEDAGDDLDVDLEGDDFSDDGDEAPGGGLEGAAQPEMGAVEDFDLGMPEEDQRKQMRACFSATMQQVQSKRDQLEPAIKEMMQAGAGQQPMTQDQALNMFVFSWMMSCYMNIDTAGISKVASGQPIPEELERELFGQRGDRPQQVQQASPRQWKLLQSVLTEQQRQQQRQQQQQQQQQQPQGSRGAGGQRAPAGPQPVGAGMSGRSQVIYVLVVFGVIFGLGALAVFRLMSHERAGRERSAKGGKRSEKTEKKAARKKM